MKVLRAPLAAAVVLCLVVTAGFFRAPVFLAQGWHRFALGAGGLVTGIDISATGVRYSHTDSNGAYIWDTANNRWYQLLCQSCIPTNLAANALNFGYYPTTGASQNSPGGPGSVVVNSVTILKKEYGNGVADVVGAPNASNVAYLYYSGHLLVSTNIDPTNTAAITFTDTLFLGGIGNAVLNCGGNYRANNHMIAVDPYNKDHVVVATQSCSNQTGGYYESFNATSGGSSTWSQISSGTIPSPSLSTDQYGLIAFDPNGSTTCRVGGGTCAAKIYIWTPGTTAGVYATSDGGTTWAIMTGSPATAQNLVVNGDPNPANGGGDVLVVDGANMSSNGNVWRFHGGVWTKTLDGTTTGHGAVHAVAINPLNGTHVVAVTVAAPLVSTDSGATFACITACTSPQTGATIAAGDSPWQAWMASRRSLTPGGVAFDPLNNDQFIFSGGQGVFKSTFSTVSSTYTAMASGIENLSTVTAIGVTAAYTPSFGVEDQGGCTYNVLTNSFANPPSVCFPMGASKGLTFASDVSTPPTNRSFGLAKLDFRNSSVPDYSGYSTDSFISNYIPFNTGFSVTVPYSALSNDAGNIKVTVASTAGLTGWSAGSGSILCSYPSKVPQTGYDALNGYLTEISCWEPINVTATSFTVKCLGISGQPCGFANLWPNFGQSYTFYALPPSLLTSVTGKFTITNVTNDGTGKVQITYDWNSSGELGGGNGMIPICISGVQMTGATAVNGCWFISSQAGLSPATLVLADSSFVGGDTYVTGGSIKAWQRPGGQLVASTTSNFVMLSANDMPTCTLDGGQTWTELSGGGSYPFPYANTVTTGSAAAGATSVPITTTSGSAGQGWNIATNAALFQIYLDDGRILYEKAVGSSFTGSIAGSVLTVTAVSSGTIWVGATISGTGIPANTTITSAGTGTGGTGTYNISTPLTVGSEAISGNAISTSGLNFTIPIPPGANVSTGNKVTVSDGFIAGFTANTRAIAADQVAPNTFFIINYNQGLLKFTNCGTPTIASANSGINAGWLTGASNQYQLAMVPGESGHGFLATGYVGSVASTHPSANGLYRFCNGDNNAGGVNMQKVTGFFEPRTVGIGAATAGHSYPAVYVEGWYDPGGVAANSVFGIWQMVDDPNHGNSGPSATCTMTGTWKNVAPGQWPTGWQALLGRLEGDPFVPGLVYGTGYGQYWGYFP